MADSILHTGFIVDCASKVSEALNPKPLFGDQV